MQFPRQAVLLFVLAVGLQFLAFRCVDAAFKTWTGHVGSRRPCLMTKAHAEPHWCDSHLYAILDSYKSGTNYRERILPDGTVCGYSSHVKQYCLRCNAGQWSSTPCKSRNRTKRQADLGVSFGALSGTVNPFESQITSLGSHIDPMNQVNPLGTSGPADISPYLLYISCKLFCNSGSNEANENGISSIYQLPSIVCPTVPGPIVAPPGSNSTHVYWPNPETHVPDGRTKWPIRVAGFGPSGDLFPEGKHRIAYTVMDSAGFADTCSFTVDVKVIRCRMPEWPKYGNRSCEMGEMIYGTSCTFTCDPGFVLDGHSRITCMYDGAYDFPIPQCKANTCRALMLPKYGVLFKCTNHNFYSSVCILVCDSNRGYRVAAQTSITKCLNNGLWTRPLPFCVDNLPPRFENCPETSIVIQAEKGKRTATVTWPDMIVRDNSGQASIQQVKGLPPGSSFGEGENKIQYSAIDPTGNKARPCSFSITVEVPKCSVPNFGDRYLKADCPNGHEYGNTCDLSCRMGLPLEGSKSLTCEIDNGLAPNAFWEWDATLGAPKCKERACSDLVNPKHGALACDNWAGGTLCQMQCNEKYDVPRTVAISQHFVCTFSTGKWSPTEKVPDCTELRRPMNMVLPSELYYYAGDCGTSQTTELIKTQFIMSLQSSASWKEACTRDRDCKARNVDVICGPLTRKRRHADRHSKSSKQMAALVTWDFSVDFDMKNLTVTEAINQHKDILKKMAANTKMDIQKGIFDLNVSGFQLGQDSFASGWSDFQCEKGQVSVYASASCAACPTGTYFNDVDCVPCPLGTYQDKDGAFDCKKCPNGTRALTPGARDISECKDLCEAGTFSPTSSVPCTPCPHGFYQENTGATSCQPCPAGTTTEFTKSLNNSVCTAYDVMVVGPASFTMKKWLTDDLGDFTLTTWIKTNAPGAENTAISLVHPQQGQLLSLDLSATAGLQLGHSNISSTVLFPLETWTHMAMVWYNWGKQLSIYVGGELVVTQTFPHVGSPLVSAGTTIKISTGAHAVVHLQGLLLHSSGRDAQSIKIMSTSCTLPTEMATLSLDDIPQASDNSVLVITPSTCDAVDECATDPCPGHTCINGRGSYHCNCHAGYTGDNCTEPPDFCADNICHNGSTCINEQGGYRCTCPPNFTDKYCQTEMIDVDGGWNLWTEWSTCSATCGGGWTVRMRECNSPPPQFNGASCNGSSVEKLECNTDLCPACNVSDLERGYGARPRCTGDQHSLTCTVTCREGLMFVESPPLYQCTGGMWTPSKTIIPCTRIDNPERLELRFKGSYEQTGCVDKATANLMSQHLMSKTDQISCVVSSLCNATAKVEPCPPDTRLKRSNRAHNIRLSVVLSVNMQGGELDLSSYHNNYKASPQLTSVTSAVEALEKSAQNLKDSGYDVFSVEGPKGRYIVNPNDVTVTPRVTCSEGSITRDAFCVGCPMGTRYSQSRCILCNLGTYQNEVGRTFCYPCPNGRTTHYRGSTHSHQCIPPKEEEVMESSFESLFEADVPSQQTETSSEHSRQSTKPSVIMEDRILSKPPTSSQTDSSVLQPPPSKEDIAATVAKKGDSAATAHKKGESTASKHSPGKEQSRKAFSDEESSSAGSGVIQKPETEPQQQQPAAKEREDSYSQFNDLAAEERIVDDKGTPSDAPTQIDREGNTINNNYPGTLVIIAVVTVCVTALIVVVIFNFMIIYRRIKRDQSPDPPSWVWSFLPGSHLKGGADKPNSVSLDRRASSTTA